MEHRVAAVDIEVNILQHTQYKNIVQCSIFQPFNLLLSVHYITRYTCMYGNVAFSFLFKLQFSICQKLCSQVAYKWFNVRKKARQPQHEASTSYI